MSKQTEWTPGMKRAAVEAARQDGLSWRQIAKKFDYLAGTVQEMEAEAKKKPAPRAAGSGSILPADRPARRL